MPAGAAPAARPKSPEWSEVCRAAVACCAKFALFEFFPCHHIHATCPENVSATGNSGTKERPEASDVVHVQRARGR